MPARREFQVVEVDNEVEADSEAEAAIMAAFASTREREKTEVAMVEIPRYRNMPQRDSGGKLMRTPEGAVEIGSLLLYFRRLQPGTLMAMRDQFTVKKPVKRGGRTQFDEAFDNEGFSVHIAYLALMPWCRKMYFDDQRLWGDDVVGTGEEFLRARLNLGELGYCLDAVQQLEGLGEERVEQLGKS